MTMRRKHPMAAPTKVPVAEVHVITVHPAVWAKAMKLARGEVRRITRVSETEVVVRNS